MYPTHPKRPAEIACQSVNDNKGKRYPVCPKHTLEPSNCLHLFLKSDIYRFPLSGSHFTSIQDNLNSSKNKPVSLTYRKQNNLCPSGEGAILTCIIFALRAEERGCHRGATADRCQCLSQYLLLLFVRYFVGNI